MHAEHTDATASVEVVETDGRLRVRWKAPTPEQFHDILSSFRCTFPRHGQCVWLPDEQIWSVALSEKPRLMRWAHSCFRRDNVTWRRDWERERMRSSSSSSSLIDPTVRAAYACLHLQVTAPPEVVAAVHRALAKLYHPDTGHGDHAAMVAVTQAVELIREHQAVRNPTVTTNTRTR